jgi:hypothetical protein
VLLPKSFEAAGILRELTDYKQNRLFIFVEYLNLFNTSQHTKGYGGEKWILGGCLAHFKIRY